MSRKDVHEDNLICLEKLLIVRFRGYEGKCEIYIYIRDNNSSERVDLLDPRFPTLAEDLRFGD